MDKHINTLRLGAIALLFAVAALLVGCSGSEDGDESVQDRFDRAAMITHWADHIILPSYETYRNELAELDDASIRFAAAPSEATLSDVRAALHDAYLAWQRVSLFEIGPAESVALRAHTNSYPTSTAKIQEALAGQTYNFDLVSARDQQGLPALDYLLHGLAATDVDLISAFESNAAATDYLRALTQQLILLTDTVINEWEGSYRETFIAASGNSATSTVDLLVNDVIFYYEKHLRAGKVGIPAGIFSNQTLPDRVESYYNPQESRAYLIEALDAFRDFLEGQSADGTPQGSSLLAYSDYLDNLRDTNDLLSEIMTNQLDQASDAISNLDPNLKEQVESDNTKMLATYDALQRLVPLLKIDMVQSMGINIDFVDTDGD